MTEPMNDFERRLADKLRAWTQDAPRRVDFAEEARLLAESRPLPRRRWLAPVLAVSTAVAAAAVTLAVISLAPIALDPATSGSPSPSVESPPSVSPDASGSPPASPPPSSPPAEDIDLSTLAWYDMVGVSFGSLTMQVPGPSPDPGAPREPYTRLRVGTLDGPIHAELRLAVEAFANGPFGTEVLVGQDVGGSSSLMLVSAADGSTRELFGTSDLVVTATLSPGGDAVYYVPVDRGSGADRGLWRWSLDGAEVEPVVDMPIAAVTHDYATSWQMRWSPDGEYLVTQACRLLECRALAYRMRDGMTMQTDAPQMLAVTDGEYLSHDFRSSSTVVAIDLDDGQSRAVGNADGHAVAVRAGNDWYIAYEPSQAEPRAYALVVLSVQDGSEQTLIARSASEPTPASILPIHPSYRNDIGAVVPNGWLLRWPTDGLPYSDTGIPPHEWFAGELIQVVTDGRLRIPPRLQPRDFPDCDPIPPNELPSGATPGNAVETHGGYWRWATWGSGSDQVAQVVGDWLYALNEVIAVATPVTVRGQPGGVQLMQSSDGPFVIAWEEAGCRYEVQLAPGLTEQDAIEYAGRY